MKQPRNLAIIPARGGSKRIPGKNIRNFLGKPIIAYSIRLARESKLFDEVMVSTDTEQIAEIALAEGAEVPFFRSEKNSGDNIPLADVIEEVIESYRSAGEQFDYACCLLPTAPLATKASLTRAYELLKERDFSSVRPVVAFSYPVQRAFRLEDDQVEFLFPEHKMTRSQDLEPTYHDAGQFYWMKASEGLRGENRGAIVIPETEAQDIDTEEDWKLAEFKYQALKKR